MLLRIFSNSWVNDFPTLNKFSYWSFIERGLCWERKVLNICILNVIMGQFDLILSKNHTKKFFFFTSYFYFLDAIVFSIPEKRPWNYSITCEKFNFIKIFDSSIKYHFTAYTFLESVFFFKVISPKFYRHSSNLVRPKK